MTFEEQLNKMQDNGICLMNHSSKESRQSICAKCQGTYWIITKEGNASRCDCWEREKQKRVLKFANIPDKYKDADFENYLTNIYSDPGKMEQIKNLCRLYTTEYKEKSKGLFIHSGTKGSGKTRMAATISNVLMNAGHTVKFATSSSILEEIKKTWSKTSEYTESRLVDDLILTEILVIDDFGAEKPKDWINEKMYYIINERYINDRTTIYTSNISLKDLDYDERIVNRIKETCYQIHFPEESMREKQAMYNMHVLKGMISMPK